MLCWTKESLSLFTQVTETPRRDKVQTPLTPKPDVRKVAMLWWAKDLSSLPTQVTLGVFVCVTCYLSVPFVLTLIKALMTWLLRLAQMLLILFYGAWITYYYSQSVLDTFSTFMQDNKQITSIPVETIPKLPSLRPTCPETTIYKAHEHLLHELKEADSNPAFLPSTFLLPHLRVPPPIVNVVPNERRRRRYALLFCAKIRIGKAFIHRTRVGRGGRRLHEQDMYVIRVDCSQPGDKHMNPAVMWDITATFREFRRLRKDLKKEMRKKLINHVKLPKVQKEGLLFLEPSLNDDILYARRDRLQKFIDVVVADRRLAGSNAFRCFCRAY